MNFVGEKFDKNNPERFNRTWICKQLRVDLKEAFGKEWKFSVRKNSSNGINISIKDGPLSSFSEIVKQTKANGGCVIAMDARAYMVDDVALNKIFKIGEAYNYDDSDIQTDYFDRNYYLHVDILMKGDL